MKTSAILSLLAATAMALPSPSTTTDVIQINLEDLNAIASTIAALQTSGGVITARAPGTDGEHANNKLAARDCMDDCLDKYCSNNMFTIVTPGSISGLAELGCWLGCKTKC
ncbi:hypothetical protein QBC39DRAFT_405649 [Podospora conica]|nr:hypothetical protein QBC39DRAFT_405649 [Schizothecium conicum]